MSDLTEPESAFAFRLQPAEDPVWQETAALARHGLHGNLTPEGLFDRNTNRELAACCLCAGQGIPEKQLRHEVLKRLASQNDKGALLPCYAVGRSPHQPILSPYWGLLAAVSNYIEASKDMEFMDTDCAGLPVYQRILKALQYLWGYFLSDQHYLFVSYGYFDSIELPGPPPEQGSPALMDAYPNLRICLEMKRILALLPAEAEQSTHWQRRNHMLENHILQSFRKPLDEGFRVREGIEQDKMELIFAPHTNILAMRMGLTRSSQSRWILKRLQKCFNQAPQQVLYLCASPEYPRPQGLEHPELLHSFSTCEHSLSILESAIYLQQAGFSTLTESFLRRVAERASGDGGFYEFYSKDECPQGRAQCREVASLFLENLGLLDLVKHGSSFTQAPGTARKSRQSSAQIQQPSLLTLKRRLRKEERRESQRIPLDIPARVRIKHGFRSKWVQATIRFPSRSGLSLQLPEEIPPHSKLQFQADTKALGGKGVLKLQGFVHWTNPGAQGNPSSSGIELSSGASDLKHWESFLMEKLLEHEESRS